MGGNNLGDYNRKSWTLLSAGSAGSAGSSKLLGRSAVSYQNISPTGNIFTADLPSPAPADKRNPFRAGGNKSTTNVAWLVGASPGPALVETVTTHHIDITAQDHLQPPSHLAVAPLNTEETDTRRMAYSLARSKTVSDLPGWADSKVKRKHSSVSDYSSQDLTASKTNVSTLGTVSTLGSLRSKIVRHKTLLGSSSRLYKFSQSLSSLTTLGTESRASLSSTLRWDNLAWSQVFINIFNYSITIIYFIGVNTYL